MKKITILGRTFQYERVSHEGPYGDTYIETYFYDGTEVVTYKKYWLWGPTITKVKPKLIFLVHYDIESNNITRSELKDRLERRALYPLLMV